MTKLDIVARLNLLARGDNLDLADIVCADAISEIKRLRQALEVLLDEATGFNVSGVYFDEECMGHKGPALARAALSNQDQ